MWVYSYLLNVLWARNWKEERKRGEIQVCVCTNWKDVAGEHRLESGGINCEFANIKAIIGINLAAFDSLYMAAGIRDAMA